MLQSLLFIQQPLSVDLSLLLVWRTKHRLSRCSIAAWCEADRDQQEKAKFFSICLLQTPIEKLLLSARHKHLLDVCRTRWIARIDVLVEVFVAILTPLEMVQKNDDKSSNPKMCKDALTLFYATVLFEFIVCLVIVARMLEVTRPLTKQLQSVNINVTESIQKISLLFSMLMHFRKGIDAVHAEAVKLAGRVGTIPLQPRSVTVQVYRPNTPPSSPSEYYKRNLTIPFLDHLTNEIQIRFSGANVDLLNSFHALPRTVIHDSSWMQKFMNFLSLYEDDLPEARYLSTEMKTWETKWKLVDESLPLKLSDVLPLVDKLDQTKKASRITDLRSMA